MLTKQEFNVRKKNFTEEESNGALKEIKSWSVVRESWEEGERVCFNKMKHNKNGETSKAGIGNKDEDSATFPLMNKKDARQRKHTDHQGHCL